MKLTITLLATLLTITNALAAEVETTLKFDNPVRDCKTYTPKKGDIEAVFSSVSSLRIRQHQENNEEFADLMLDVAFGKCINGQWLRYNATPLITKAEVQRSLFNKKKFALKATFAIMDAVNDGRDGSYSPSVKIGLNVSLTKIKELLKSSDQIEVVAHYELIAGSGVIYARYTFKKSASGEVTFSMTAY